nr:hypothetical protein 1634Bnrm2_p048 [Cryptomonas sp.]
MYIKYKSKESFPYSNQPKFYISSKIIQFFKPRPPMFNSIFPKINVVYQYKHTNYEKYKKKKHFKTCKKNIMPTDVKKFVNTKKKFHEYNIGYNDLIVIHKCSFFLIFYLGTIKMTNDSVVQIFRFKRISPKLIFYYSINFWISSFNILKVFFIFHLKLLGKFSLKLYKIFECIGN